MSEDITSISTEVKGLQDQVVGLVTDLQKKIDEKDAITKEEIQKLSDIAAQKAEEHQKLTAKIKAAEEKQKQLESLITARPSIDKDKGGVSSKEYMQAFNATLRSKAPIKHDVVDSEIRKMVSFFHPTMAEKDVDSVVKTLSVGSDPDGGYYAPVDRLRAIYERLYESTPMRNLATVISTAMESVSIVIDDNEVDSGWQCEFADISTNTATPTIGEKTISTHIQYAYPKATQKIIDDASIDLSAWLQGKIANKFTRTENSGFTVGDGVEKPRGFLTFDARTDPEIYERGKLGTYDTATAQVVALPDIVNLQSGLLEDLQQDAVFMGHRLTWGEIIKLEDGEDRPLINPQLLFSGTDIMLLGKPFIFSSDMPKPDPTSATPFTTGDKFLAYGNFREGYLIVDRMGIRIIRDNITKKGFVQWYATKRVGGDVSNYQAIKILRAS